MSFTLWLTGIPCAGKTSVSLGAARALQARGLRVEVLDGDEVRKHLGQGLGFSRQDRDTNVHRIGYVCRLLNRNDVVAIVAAVSPYRAARDEVRQSLERFIEVHVDCPIGLAEARDTKGQYARARRGELTHFTGISDPYEAPLEPELVLHTDIETLDVSVRRVVITLENLSCLP